MPNTYLEFIPEYSPDYNLIELVWHATKEYIANRVFKLMEELEYLLHRLLNKRQLLIKWGRKSKTRVMLVSHFKCATAYQTISIDYLDSVGSQ